MGGYRELCIKAGLEPNKRPQDHEPIELKPRKPKILILDIETAPLLVRCYGLWEQNINTGFIQKDWYMLSFAAKWFGENKFYYKDTRNTHENDFEVAQLAWDMMNEADVIVGHNVKRFDIKKLQTRFLKHGLPPIGKKQVHDTLTIAKKHFAITSNKLDYIAEFLGLTKKVKSKKYTQQEMWNGCCDGVKDCFVHNEKYNKGDIVTSEEVYIALSAWEQSINLSAISRESTCTNPTCDSVTFRKDGFDYTKVGAFQRYRCCKCGKIMVSRSNYLTKEDRTKIEFK